MYRDHFETFELHGLTFAAYTTPDDSHGRPWVESDCYGIVREATGENYANVRPLKSPGERFLKWERRWGLAYDWQGTMKKARAEGWGLGAEARAALIERNANRDALAAARREQEATPPHGRPSAHIRAAELVPQFTREPTRGEIVAESVRLDFERLRAWANGEWHYVGVIVELLDTEGNGTGEDESLWAIESDCADYHADSRARTRRAAGRPPEPDRQERQAP